MRRYFTHQCNAIRLGHGDCRSASKPTDAGRDVRARLAARDVYRRHHAECRAAVHGAADVYQDGAAPFWRRAVGVVGGHRVLPDCAARGLRLRPRAHALRGPARVGRDPSGSDDRRCIRAATIDPHRRAAEPVWWMVLSPASSGLPFFALAANSPLLQAWFARTDHPAAKDPYFLYAASNVGSFFALVSYPIVIEPFVRLGDQAWSWSIGFCLLIALLAGCGALRWHSPHENVRADGTAEAAPSWKDAGFWMALAAVRPTALCAGP